MTGAPDSLARRRFRFGWLAVAALAIVAISVATFVVNRFRGEKPPQRPSIILALVDTLRADYLGAYGFEGDVSPHLDRFAREAVLFESAFSQAPWTKPSVASLFTSLYPIQHGVVAHGNRFGSPTGSEPSASALPARAVTLAEELHRAGYETAAFVANPWIQSGLGFAQGFDVFDEKTTGNKVGAEVLLAKARAWLASRADDRPFFLYLHFMDVHGPYEPSAEDLRAVADSPSLGPPRPLRARELAARRQYLMKNDWASQAEGEQLRSWRARYAAGVRALDRELGAFLEELARDGVLDDAVVVVTADHGEELADHGDWDHGDTLYDEQIHVPLLVRLPGAAHAGQRVDRIVSLIDVMPTLLGLARIEPPASLSGRDLDALLDGRDLDGPEIAHSSGVKWQPELESVRTRSHKLVRNRATGETHLFDLGGDPAERHDVAGTTPEIGTDLTRELEAHDAELARSPPPAGECASSR